MPATPGTYSVASYNIYRNGSLYDNITTPITITGYIVPATMTSQNTGGANGGPTSMPVGLLTITAVSGGTTSISDGLVLGGLMLSSVASGFVAGTQIFTQQTPPSTGGTGNYYVTNSQTVGTSGSPVTFTGWSYNDTASTNSIPYNCQGSPGPPATIYKYSVTAVDSHGTEGPASYPAMYSHYGMSFTGFANYSFGGLTTWDDTTGAPVNGPYDIMLVASGGGYGFQPVWSSAYGDGNNPGTLGAHSYMTPCCHAEVGAFNYFVFDIKPNDTTYNGGVGPTITQIMRSYGLYSGIDSIAEKTALNIGPYCTPPLASGQWSHCKIPFSQFSYGVATVTGVFYGCANYGTAANGSAYAGSGLYQGVLKVTAISSQQMGYFAGCCNITGSGIPANSAIAGGQNGGQGGYTNPQGPYTSFPYYFDVYGPNIVGTENTGSITVQIQGSSAYKWNITPGTSLADGVGTIFLNNVGFTTV